jgi:hypothetical protein
VRGGDLLVPCAFLLPGPCGPLGSSFELTGSAECRREVIVDLRSITSSHRSAKGAFVHGEF